jgi:hypothetical protein
VPHEDVDEDIGVGVGPVGGFLAVFELEVGRSGGGHDEGEEGACGMFARAEGR